MGNVNVNVGCWGLVSVPLCVGESQEDGRATIVGPFDDWADNQLVV